MHMMSMYAHTYIIAMFSLKKLTPWRDSNPDLLLIRWMRGPLRHTAAWAIKKIIILPTGVVKATVNAGRRCMEGD
jgi:hypothetical protein